VWLAAHILGTIASHVKDPPGEALGIHKKTMAMDGGSKTMLPFMECARKVGTASLGKRNTKTGENHDERLVLTAKPRSLLQRLRLGAGIFKASL
jgi:hypothetical protein